MFVLPGLMRSLAKLVFATGSKRGEGGTAGSCEERGMKKRKEGMDKGGEGIWEEGRKNSSRNRDLSLLLSCLLKIEGTV